MIPLTEIIEAIIIKYYSRESAAAFIILSGQDVFTNEQPRLTVKVFIKVYLR